MITQSICALAMICSLPATEPEFAIAPESTAPIEQKSYEFRFQLLDVPRRAAIGENDLELSHERLLHVIVYDSALREFQHVHPQFNGTYWKASLDFDVSGQYWLWTQGELKRGSDLSATTFLDVKLPKPAWPSPVLREDRRGSDGVSQVELGSSHLRAGRSSMIQIKFKRTNSTAPVITPYLGAIAHVVAVPSSGESIVHVHPMAGNSPTEGMLHVTFPKPGMYRLWIEFMDDGRHRTVPLAVEVH